jgi:uncharacterized membrane protein
MSRQKAQDEIFCRSCGDPIKKKAEICPHCGVENRYDGSGRQQQSNHSTVTHDPSQYSAAVSDKWHYAVAASVVMWVLAFVLPDVFGITGMLTLLAWVLMPIATYYDAQWIRANTEWNPNSEMWIFASAIPLVNIVSGALYMIRQHNVSRNFTVDEEEAGPEDPLTELKRQYSQGEFTDEEFESRVEQLLETEDRESARKLIEQQQNDR